MLSTASPEESLSAACVSSDSYSSDGTMQDLSEDRGEQKESGETFHFPS